MAACFARSLMKQTPHVYKTASRLSAIHAVQMRHCRPFSLNRPSYSTSVDGTSLLQDGKFDEAIQLFEAAVQADSSPTNTYNLAIANLAKGDISAASKLLQDVIQKDENFADAFINLGSIKAQTGDIQGALINLTKAVELAPEDGQAVFNLAVVSEASGDLKAAYHLYTRAQALLPDFPKDLLRNCEAKIRAQADLTD
eukprot:m.25714 g.25714  ORF g.25714 m.25714 type:complete len:198 (+) comp11623_c0_seq2:1581-2174(+)